MKSHIIPEFYYKRVYDDKYHRFVKMSTNINEKISYAQKGTREKMLCSECEQKLSIWEKYTSNLFYGNSLTLTKSIYGKMITWHGVDYKKFKLFQLSVIWRASVAEHDFFRNVSLGPHEEKIRLMIVNEDPGSYYQYGAFLIFLKDQNQPTDKMIIQPEEMRLETFRAYQFVFGSHLWMYVISSHNEKFPAGFSFLQENGDLNVLVKDMIEIEYMRDFIKKIYRTGKLSKTR